MSDRTNLDKVLIFSATQCKNPEDTLLYSSVGKWQRDVDLYFAVENTKSLASVYNEAIQMARKGNYDALILVHDDVILEHDPIPKLIDLFQKYDVVGVAGASKLTLESPALWHLMGGGFQGGHLHGAVSHGTQDKKYMTSFGEYPHRVLMIDGVFMAISRDVLDVAGFDTSNPAKFHFYDLDFSYYCALNGFRVGVGDISITHASPGLREFTPEWKAGEEWFLNKYANE